MKVTATQIAALVGATIEGDPEVLITGPAKIEEATAGSITFYGNPAYERHLYTTEASAVLVPMDFEPKGPITATLLRVDDVYLTISKLLEHFQDQAKATPRTISAHAIVVDTAELGARVRVGKLSIVSEGATVGAGTIIHDQVFVGPDVIIGLNCVLHPGVKILASCRIGNNCIIHSNAVIGGDGFGFAPDPETGSYKKIPQVGNVVIEDDVEIGANTTIDRASMGSTIIRSGVKLDNLIQIAHNVEIKENTVIAALTGIAGSAKIGANCRIGGQVGISGHITLADATLVQGQTGVNNNVKKAGQALAGSPFMPWSNYTRSAAAYKMLPAFIKDVRKRLRNLEGK